MAGTKLSDVRAKLGESDVIRKGLTFAFCSDEAAITASEEVTLEGYARTLHGDPVSSLPSSPFLIRDNC